MAPTFAWTLGLLDIVILAGIGAVALGAGLIAIMWLFGRKE